MRELMLLQDTPLDVVGETPFGFSLSTSNYFASLPVFVQETIMQENANIQNDKELRNIAENLLNRSIFQ